MSQGLVKVRQGIGVHTALPTGDYCRRLLCFQDKEHAISAPSSVTMESPFSTCDQSLSAVSYILCLHYDAKPYWCGTARYGTAKQTCVNSALSHRTVPYRSQRVRSQEVVWCGTLRYGTSKYLRVNTSRADAVSL